MRSLNGSFFIYGKSGTQVSCSLFIFIILKPKEAERRIFMSAIIHVMGRVTKDPAMQQGKKSTSVWILLPLRGARTHKMVRMDTSPCSINAILTSSWQSV